MIKITASLENRQTDGDHYVIYWHGGGIAGYAVRQSLGMFNRKPKPVVTCDRIVMHHINTFLCDRPGHTPDTSHGTFGGPGEGRTTKIDDVFKVRHDVTPKQDDRGIWYVPIAMPDRIWAISEWVEYPDGVAWVRADRVQDARLPVDPCPAMGMALRLPMSDKHLSAIVPEIVEEAPEPETLPAIVRRQDMFRGPHTVRLEVSPDGTARLSPLDDNRKEVQVATGLNVVNATITAYSHGELRVDISAGFYAGGRRNPWR